jgi:site-specific recombinase XerD
MNDFFKTVRSFILEYLPKQRCYSENTMKSYRIALNLLVEYMRTDRKLTVQQINFTAFNRDVILGFLDWLEANRHCSVSSRNQRLMVLRSFFGYAGILDCTQTALQLEVENIPAKTEQGRIIEYLTEDALAALLRQPDIRKRNGIRDQFFMTLMYDTAARCGELLNMRVGHLRINGKHPTAYLLGKGNKPRVVALLSKTVEHCNRYLQIYHNSLKPEDYLFYTIIHGQKNPMSHDTVARFMKQYGELARSQCPEVPARIHPHQLRHTRAVHYYRDGMPLALIAEQLGHASVEATKIYAYSDSEMKRAAMEKADLHRNTTPPVTPIWKDDADMILRLSGLK